MIQKTTWVYSNDPTNPLVLLTIKGTVKQLIEILPSPSLSIRASRGETAEGKLTLVNRDRSPLKISNITSTSRDFTTELRTVEKGQRYELLVKFKGNDTDGRFATLLTVFTNKKRLPQIPIAVVATVADINGR